MLAPGAGARLATASAALVVAPTLAWRAATAGALDGLCALLLGPPDTSRRLTLAAVAAVVAVNLVMAAYVVAAFAEAPPAAPRARKDE